jgi:hypothetical protein
MPEKPASRTRVYVLSILLLIALVSSPVIFAHSLPAALAQTVRDGSENVPGLDSARTSAAPSAEFTGDPTAGLPPLQVHFTDESAGSPAGWAWYFGDEDFLNAWVQAPTASWAQRSSHTSVVLPDGSIVLMGGYTGSSYLNDVWRSTNLGDTWVLMTGEAEWPARYFAASVALPDGSIVLMGGFDGSSFKNDVWRSIDKGATWVQMTADAGWAPRTQHASVALPNGSIILMGGGGSKSYNDVWRSIDQGETWEQMTAGAEWSQREGHASVALHDGSIVLMGGWAGQRKSDVWRSTNQGSTWMLINAYSSWAPRTGHSCVLTPDGSLLLSGGSTGLSPNITYQNDVWRSTDQGKTWDRLTAAAEWSGRSANTTVALPDGSIVLMAGFRAGNRLNDVWRLKTAGSNLQNPVHTYTEPGSYQVSLQVYNPDGYTSIRKPGYITPANSETFMIQLPCVLKNLP